MDNKIAVLLPVYHKDNPKYLKIAIDSILQQIYNNLSIYVGCDGPLSDELNLILKGFKDNSKIKILRFNENRGLAAVLNDLIKAAEIDNVDFYARMDADDISLPDRFKNQIEFLLKNPNIDVVGGTIEEINQDSIPIGKRVIYPSSNADCKKFFRYRDPLAHPAVMFRKSFFEKVKIGYRSEYRKNQDTMLWYDGFMSGCVFSNLNEVVLKFRVTPDFYNRRNGWKRAKQMLRDRLRINRDLKFDISANLFAYAMFFITISPKWIKKILYRIR